jgi:hypothetical protein
VFSVAVADCALSMYGKVQCWRAADYEEELELPLRDKPLPHWEEMGALGGDGGTAGQDGGREHRRTVAAATAGIRRLHRPKQRCGWSTSGGDRCGGGTRNTGCDQCVAGRSAVILVAAAVQIFFFAEQS